MWQLLWIRRAHTQQLYPQYFVQGFNDTFFFFYVVLCSTNYFVDPAVRYTGGCRKSFQSSPVWMAATYSVRIQKKVKKKIVNGKSYIDDIYYFQKNDRFVVCDYYGLLFVYCLFTTKRFVEIVRLSTDFLVTAGWRMKPSVMLNKHASWCCIKTHTKNDKTVQKLDCTIPGKGQDIDEGIRITTI